MIQGKSFNIYNYTDGDLVINDMEHEGYGWFRWYIDPWNLTLPHTMAFMDTLSLNVKIDLPVDNISGYFVTDTLDIYTQNSHHKVVIKVDSDLLSSLKDPTAQSSSSRIESIIPNPFNNMTRITFSLDKAQNTLLVVYNLQGQVIKILADYEFSASTHELVWDGRDGSGNKVPQGIYLLKLKTQLGVDLKKLIVSY
jgi:hypothetical protein